MDAGTMRRVAMIVVAIVVSVAGGYGFGRAERHSTARRSIDATDPAAANSIRVRNPFAIQETRAPSARAPHDARKFGLLPTGPFVSDIDELRRRADAGDGAAALALAKGYRRCVAYRPSKNQAELAKQVEDETVMKLDLSDQLTDFLRKRLVQAGQNASRVPRADSMASYDETLRQARALQRNCEGVEAGDVRRWVGWYRRAAELGDREAELSYWHQLLLEDSLVPLDELASDRDVARSALQQALAAGDWRALAAIGEALEVGYFADPDAYDAEVYLFAADQAMDDEISRLPWLEAGIGQLFTGTRSQPYIEHLLARAATHLDAAEVEAAERKGRALYARCCTGGGP